MENCVKLVMPSPTAIAAGRIRRATAAREPVVLGGVIQGGGPCHWALQDHLRAGLAAYATPEAATTFDDDLDAVRAMGVSLVSEEEAAKAAGRHIELRDLDLDAIRAALAAFDVDPAFDGFALGCLDHGAAPPGYSDRLFRFDHLRGVVQRSNDLRAFAYLPEELPDYLTRARALIRSLKREYAPSAAISASPSTPALSPVEAERRIEGVRLPPTIFLDTGPAAALGALQDPVVAQTEAQFVLNLGNMHALAFHLRRTQIISLYEHHTGEMTNGMIEDFSERLIAGSLHHDEVFGSKGHGVFYAEGPHPLPPGEDHPAQREGVRGARRRAPRPFLAVTGPQRERLRPPRAGRLQPYFAAPHGDMMISGCFGMLQAFAYRFPQHRDEIERALSGD
jgi:uncharacterized protein (DUF1786 family)